MTIISSSCLKFIHAYNPDTGCPIQTHFLAIKPGHLFNQTLLPASSSPISIKSCTVRASNSMAKLKMSVDRHIHMRGRDQTWRELIMVVSLLRLCAGIIGPQVLDPGLPQLNKPQLHAGHRAIG